MHKILLESSFIKSLFQCPLCHDILHLATTINECFHRFCKLCIMNYFANDDQNKSCPVCQIVLINPLQTLKPDLTFQRVLYKIFPKNIQRDIACSSSPCMTNDRTIIDNETKINVCLEHWDISSDLFPNDTRASLPTCYLECLSSTTLASIEKILRVKYSLSTALKIDLFYKTFLLNIDTERLIDLCYCFNLKQKNSRVDIRYCISPYGYTAIVQQIRQIKKPKLKVKICRSHTSYNNWYISQANSSSLPDLIKSCKLKKKKSRRHARFIPTMVQFPPSIFDRPSNKQYHYERFQAYEQPITEIISDAKSTQKTVCKVQPYIPENSIQIESAILSEKSFLFDIEPLDLSLK